MPCKTCKWFVPENAGYGHCHLLPPMNGWPRVQPDAFCGQETTRPTAKVIPSLKEMIESMPEISSPSLPAPNVASKRKGRS